MDLCVIHIRARYSFLSRFCNHISLRQEVVQAMVISGTLSTNSRCGGVVSIMYIVYRLSIREHALRYWLRKCIVLCAEGRLKIARTSLELELFDDCAITFYENGIPCQCLMDLGMHICLACIPV